MGKTSLNVNHEKIQDMRDACSPEERLAQSLNASRFKAGDTVSK